MFPPPSQAALRGLAFYYAAWVFLLIKALTAVATVAHTGLVNPNGGAVPRLLWFAGKITPELLCVCFLIDAISNRRSRGMIWFWGILAAVVPFLAVYFGLRQAAHGR